MNVTVRPRMSVTGTTSGTEVVEPVRLVHVGSHEWGDALIAVSQSALPSFGPRDAEALGPPVGPGVTGGGGKVLGPSPTSRAPPN